MSIDSVIKPIGDAAGALGKIGGALTTIRGLTGSGYGQSSRYMNLAGNAASAQADIAREQARLAREQWQNYKDNFLPLERAQAAEAARDLAMYRPLKEAVVAEGLAGLRRIAPLEQKLFDDAMEGDSADIPGATAEAAAQVQASFAKAREQAGRDAEKMEAQPERTAYLDRITDLSQAASEAAARTVAARDEKARAENFTWEKLGQAMGAHQGLPSPPSSTLAPQDARGISADASARALGLMREASGGLGQAASNYASLGRQTAALNAAAPGLFHGFASTTDVADAWNAPSIFGLPGVRY